jgi:hypothetical protein
VIHGLLVAAAKGRGWACGHNPLIKITHIVGRDLHTKVGGRGRNRTLSDAVLETTALPVSYTPDIWHRLPVTIQRLCGHNAALCH